jgi:hypothetical protein
VLFDESGAQLPGRAVPLPVLTPEAAEEVEKTKRKKRNKWQREVAVVRPPAGPGGGSQRVSNERLGEKVVTGVRACRQGRPACRGRRKARKCCGWARSMKLWIGRSAG